MHTNMNFPAPVAVLGLMAAVGGLLLTALVILFAWSVKRPRLAKWMALLAGSGAVVYLGLLLGFSLASKDTTLARGEEKYFCEIDCHLAYAVLEVTQASRIMSAAGPRSATGVFYIVKLRTRFDEHTIAPRRGNAPLTPGPRVVKVVDDAGRQYTPLATSNVTLLTPLRPGESYTRELVFDVAAGARGPRLLLTSAVAWPDLFMIGEENSLLHRKTWFSL